MMAATGTGDAREDRDLLTRGGPCSASSWSAPSSPG
jgi:hypothetical protein